MKSGTQSLPGPCATIGRPRRQRTDEAVGVRGSIGGELKQRYGNRMWRAKVNFPSSYAYVQAFKPRFLYIPETEVVARPIRGGSDRPILKSIAAVEIEGGGEGGGPHRATREVT